MGRTARSGAADLVPHAPLPKRGGAIGAARSPAPPSGLAAARQPSVDPSAHEKRRPWSAGRPSARPLVRGSKPGLTAPGGAEDHAGKRRPHRRQGGPPQGGVCSPLRATSAVPRLARVCLAYGRATGRAAKRVRAADAVVIRRRGGGKEPLKPGKPVVVRRAVTLPEEKRRGGDARAGSGDVLGFPVARQRRPTTAKGSTVGNPARKAAPQVREAGRGLTRRRSHARPPPAGGERGTREGRGGVHYLPGHNATRVCTRPRCCCEQRRRQSRQTRRQSQGCGYRRGPASRL